MTLRAARAGIDRTADRAVVDGGVVQHEDPGDRFIVATASMHGLTVVTPDPMIAAYPNTSVLW